MSKSTRITVRLPDEIVDAVDSRRRIRGESRSAFLEQTLRSLLQSRNKPDEESEAEEKERYIRGYREYPETEEEMEEARILAAIAFAEDPWE